MAGREWRMCYQCFERSRNNRAWYCPHCGDKKPKMTWAVTSLGKPPMPTPKVDQMGYRQWLAENKRENNPKAWTDYCLRGLRVLPK